MKRLTVIISLFVLTSTICLAQGPVSKAQNAVAQSQIRVQIAPYAVIDLARNNSTSVSYHSSSELKNLIKISPDTKVEANNQWSVNITTDNTFTGTSKKPSATENPSYTVVYVTTRI